MTRRAPAAVLLRPGLRVLPRGRGEVQVGTDPRWAVRITGLGDAEARLWAAVDDTTDLRSLPERAVPAGADPAAVAATVADLERAGLTRDRPDTTSTVRGPAAADAAAWTLLHPRATGDAVVAARAQAVVGVAGLGPTGLAVARHLAVAGVGGLLLDDDAPVRSADVAAGTHRWADVGAPRAVAARRVLREAAPGTRVDGDEEPEVVVVVERDAADPQRAARLTAEGVPHLSVVVRAADALVGPFVRPGTAPCLRCLDLHRADADPAWPVVLAALTSGDAGLDARLGEVGVLAGACAAIAAAQVLTALAGGVPSLCGGTVEVTLPDLAVRGRRWTAHPACGCTGLPATTDAGPPER